MLTGDKIVTVNGKSLSGLTYRESTDFIRQCPGPNVKMGIIKHALYKKEGILLYFCQNDCHSSVAFLSFTMPAIAVNLSGVNLNCIDVFAVLVWENDMILHVFVTRPTYMTMS